MTRPGPAAIYNERLSSTSTETLRDLLWIIVHQVHISELTARWRITRITRSSLLTTVVVIVLLAALPGTIRRLIETGDPYLFSRQFFQDMMARLSGPGRFRFIIQPIVAILLGSRDGAKDALRGLPPFLWGMAFHREHRGHLLRTALASVRDLLAIAILLDILSQYLIFHQIHTGAALLLGPVLISLPYSVSRAIANRVAGQKLGHGSDRTISG